LDKTPLQGFSDYDLTPFSLWGYMSAIELESTQWRRCFIAVHGIPKQRLRPMKWFMLVVLITLAAGGCSRHVYDEPYPDLLEAEHQQVKGCTLLGVISETADAANPWSLAAETNMVFRVRERAGQLGATHLVWRHRTGAMATGQAYHCP
jgi:hypothetical protein